MPFESNVAGTVLGDGSSLTIGHEATGTILSVPENSTDRSLMVRAKIGLLCPEQVCYVGDGCRSYNSWCVYGKAIMSISGLTVSSFHTSGHV